MDIRFHEEPLTLGFTDVVNSTELALKYRAHYLMAQEKHRGIIREILQQWHGTEVKTLGDGFFLAFENPLDAVQWAKETQKLLAKQSWPLEMPFQIRIGLHFGNPLRIVHPDGRPDYDGDAVNLASRMVNEAKGGQICVSRAFYDQIARELSPPFGFQDRGRPELKGFGRTQVWQLTHPDLPDLAAPFDPEDLTSVEVPPSNLPFPPNAHFYGREEALLDLRSRLMSLHGQTVALVGMGGLGKTQMAVEYAHTYLFDYPGGIYWLDARNDERLLEDYAGIGKRFYGLNHNLPREQLAERVRDEVQRLKKPALLIFDNVTEKTDLNLLPPSGRLHLLLTTQRQVLPANVTIIEPPRLSEASSLQLLQVFRQPTNDKEREAALQIVRTVGNLPLALALASHHIRALGCNFSEYHRRLTENPYHTLQRGRNLFRSATRHEGSIYDTIDLSIRGTETADTPGERLDENALKILAATACFAPNSIPTDLLFKATGILHEEDFEGALLQLWERSLMMREQNENAEGRQSVHELIREYARTNLLPTRRKSVLPRAVHALTEHLKGANQRMQWTTVRNDLDHCYAVAAEARGKTPPAGLEELLLEIGVYLADHRDDLTALTYYKEGLDLTRQRHGKTNLLYAKFLRLMAEASQREGETGKALALMRASRWIARQLLPKNAPAMADYCNSLGYVLKMQGRLRRALPFYLHALAIHRTQPEAQQTDVAVLLNNLGTLLEDQRDFPGALEHFQQALAHAEAQEREENLSLPILLNNTGRVLGKMDDWENALALHERARQLCEAMQGARHPDTAACFFYLAEAQRGRERYEEALANYGRAKKIYERSFGTAHSASQRVRDRIASLEADPQVRGLAEVLS